MTSQWKFWRHPPNLSLLVFAVGLAVSGLTMIITPESYRSFFVTIWDLDLTPKWLGMISLAASVSVVLTRAATWSIAFMVGVFFARGALLFTAWLDPRIPPPPPATRWVWEIAIALVILINAPGHRRTAQ